MQKFQELATSAKTKAYAVGTSLMVAAPFAMASGGGAADFDGSEIITKVIAYTAVGVAILAAFALGRWTLRALGLIGGK